MEIRNIEKKDIQQKYSIMHYCFQGKEAEVTQEYIASFVPENHIGMFEGDQLMSSLEIVPKHIVMYTKPMKMGGLGGITSFPEFRYGGTAKMLILRSLEIMRERKMLISFLKPFSYSFYRKYGWETHLHKKHYSIPISSLSKIGVNLHTFKRLSYDDLPAVKSMYERHILQYNGCAMRTENDWKGRFAGHFVYGSIDGSGRIKGYLIFTIDQKTMNVDEFICDDIDAQRDLLQFIHRHDSQINEVILTSAPDDLTDIILGDPPITELLFKMMARVVDVAEFLKFYDYGNFEGEFNINIKDPWAEWNNHTFAVQVKSGKASVAETQSDEDISISIGAFSQMVMGYAGFSKQLYMKRVEYCDADKKAVFDAMFPDRKTDLYDFF